MSNFVNKAREYGIRVHNDANHYYGDKPYAYHLGMVAFWVREFSYLLTKQEAEIAEAAAWVHDSIEDARQTYNDVKAATSLEVAEIAFAVTTEKGRSRKERANRAYYEGIRANRLALLVKLADRLANVQHSTESKSRMAELYQKEMDEFLSHLFEDFSGSHEFWPMAEKLKSFYV